MRANSGKFSYYSGVFCVTPTYSKPETEAYTEPCQTSTTERFAKIVKAIVVFAN